MRPHTPIPALLTRNHRRSRGPSSLSSMGVSYGVLSGTLALAEFGGTHANTRVPDTFRGGCQPAGPTRDSRVVGCHMLERERNCPQMPAAEHCHKHDKPHESTCPHENTRGQRHRQTTCFHNELCQTRIVDYCLVTEAATRHFLVSNHERCSRVHAGGYQWSLVSVA